MKQLSFFDNQEQETKDQLKLEMLKKILNRLTQDTGVNFVHIKNIEDKNNFPWRE